HRRPTDRFALERDAGSGAAGDGEISGKGKAQCQRNGAELVLGLNEYAAVFWQLGPQDFHDRRPGRDRITGAVAHTGGDQSESDRGIAIHRDLGASASFLDLLKLILPGQDIADRIGIAGLERHHRRVDDALVFAGKFFGDDPLQLVDIETENFRDQAEDENIFALVL